MPPLPTVKELIMNATVHKITGNGAGYRSGRDAMLRLNPDGETFQLQASQFAQLCDAAGWTVRALAGMVWITQDGDTRDVVLQAGESIVLDRNGLALLSPLGDAHVSVALCAGRAAPRHGVVAPLPPVTAQASFA